MDAQGEDIDAAVSLLDELGLNGSQVDAFEIYRACLGFHRGVLEMSTSSVADERSLARLRVLFLGEIVSCFRFMAGFAPLGIGQMRDRQRNEDWLTYLQEVRVCLSAPG